MEISIKPFDMLDKYLEAAYIILNYPDLSIQKLCFGLCSYGKKNKNSA